MKFNIFLSIFIVFASRIRAIENGETCAHTADVKPQQWSCDEREAYYINYYYNNGCSSVKACLIPASNNKIFPESYKAKNPSECIVINSETYCAADLVESLPCENCTFPKLIEEIKKIMGDEFQYEFSKDSNITVPPDVINEKIQCAINQPLNNDYEKCSLSDGYFIHHEFHPDCDKTFYACFYEKTENIDGVDPKVIISEDKSKCLVKKEEQDVYTYCAVGYSNISCEGCDFSAFTKKAKEIFDDYLEKEVGTNNEIKAIKKVETVGSTSDGIKILSFNNYLIFMYSLLIILLLKKYLK